MIWVLLLVDKEAVDDSELVGRLAGKRQHIDYSDLSLPLALAMVACLFVLVESEERGGEENVGENYCTARLFVMGYVMCDARCGMRTDADMRQCGNERVKKKGEEGAKACTTQTK